MHLQARVHTDRTDRAAVLLPGRGGGNAGHSCSGFGAKQLILLLRAVESQVAVLLAQRAPLILVGSGGFITA